MEMKQPSQTKHQIFFPHGFIDPLTGDRRTRFYVDDRHFQLLKAAAERQGTGLRAYVKGLLKEGKTPFSEEASEFAKTAGQKETVKVSVGVPYFIRFAQEADFRQTWERRSLKEWVEFFAWQDRRVAQCLEKTFKGEQSTVDYSNPAFKDPDCHCAFSEFIANLSYHFFVKNHTEIDLLFALKDGCVMLSKISI